MELRIVVAVGNMIDVLGFGGVFGGDLMVDSVGMRVVSSHFSPTEAMEETCATI